MYLALTPTHPLQEVSLANDSPVQHTEARSNADAPDATADPRASKMGGRLIDICIELLPALAGQVFFICMQGLF